MMMMMMIIQLFMMLQIDGLVRPGLTSLTWTSINLDRYFDLVKSGIDELVAFVNQVSRRHAMLNCYLNYFMMQI